MPEEEREPNEPKKEKVPGLDFDCPNCGYSGQFEFEDCPTCGNKGRKCPQCGFRLKLIFPPMLEKYEPTLESIPESLPTEGTLGEPTTGVPSFDVSIPEAPPEPDLTLKGEPKK